MTAAVVGVPRRVQRRRIRGWRKPAGSVIVDRTSRWGNPFAVGRPAGPLAPDPDEIVADRARAVALYQQWYYGPGRAGLRAAARTALVGHDLVCPCPVGEPCHGEVLLTDVNHPDRWPAMVESRVMVQEYVKVLELFDMAKKVAGLQMADYATHRD